MRTQLAGGDYLPISSVDFRSYVPEVTLEKTAEGKQFELTSADAGTLTIVPITWYKGYRVYYLDGDQRSEVPVSEIQGLIAARTDRPGTYLVVYQGTLLQKVSFGISVAAFIYSVVRAVMKKDI